MRTVNKAYIVGRLGADPEPTDDGCRMSVATDRLPGDVVDWHHVVVTGPLAERCLQQASKGATVSVEGLIRYDRDGGQTLIVAQRVSFLEVVS